MAVFDNTLQFGTGANFPKSNVLAGSWGAPVTENVALTNSDTWISTQNTNLLILPQVYGTPL